MAQNPRLFTSKTKAKIAEAFAAKESSTVDDVMRLIERLEAGTAEVDQPSAAPASAPKTAPKAAPKASPASAAKPAPKKKASNRAEEMLKKSVSLEPDSAPAGKIQCLECGQYFGALARHLTSVHNMSADAYRKKHKIPADQPLTAESQKAAAPSAASASTTPSATKQTPAVPLDQAFTDELVTCLECGKSMKMLKRHLGSAHDLTPDQYRAKWDLPDDFPVTAPKYSEAKSQYAKEVKLGEASSPIAPKRRGRKKKSETS